MQNQPVCLLNSIFTIKNRLITPPKVDSENISIPWNVVRWFFKREQEDAHSIIGLKNHISALEGSLHSAGCKAQCAIIKKNTLSANYQQLHRDYLKLFEAYEYLETRINNNSEGITFPEGLGISNMTSRDHMKLEDVSREEQNAINKA